MVARVKGQGHQVQPHLKGYINDVLYKKNSF